MKYKCTACGKESYSAKGSCGCSGWMNTDTIVVVKEVKPKINEIPTTFHDDIHSKIKSALVEKASDKKYDEGKAMVGLMKKDFSKALAYVSTVTTYGVKKYNAPGSWRLVPDALKRYEDALGRHDLLMCTEDYDDESKLLHAGHRAWNALATLELILKEIDEKS